MGMSARDAYIQISQSLHRDTFNPQHSTSEGVSFIKANITPSRQSTILTNISKHQHKSHKFKNKIPPMSDKEFDELMQKTKQQNKLPQQSTPSPPSQSSTLPKPKNRLTYEIPTPKQNDFPLPHYLPPPTTIGKPRLQYYSSAIPSRSQIAK